MHRMRQALPRRLRRPEFYGYFSCSISRVLIGVAFAEAALPADGVRGLFRQLHLTTGV
jgi:hypothetical protein